VDWVGRLPVTVGDGLGLSVLKQTEALGAAEDGDRVKGDLPIAALNLNRTHVGATVGTGGHQGNLQ
jgi:hypothetical protein